MAQGTIEVLSVDGAWRVRVDGMYTLRARYETRPEAIAAGSDLARARGVRLIVQAGAG